MQHQKPIDWIRELYQDSDEETIAEAEDNFRTFILFLFYSNIGRSPNPITESDTLTHLPSHDNVKL